MEPPPSSKIFSPTNNLELCMRCKWFPVNLFHNSRTFCSSKWRIKAQGRRNLRRHLAINNWIHTVILLQFAHWCYFSIFVNPAIKQLLRVTIVRTIALDLLNIIKNIIYRLTELSNCHNSQVTDYNAAVLLLDIFFTNSFVSTYVPKVNSRLFTARS